METPLTIITRTRVEEMITKNPEWDEDSLLEIVTPKILSDIFHEQMLFGEGEIHDIAIEIEFHEGGSACIEECGIAKEWVVSADNGRRTFDVIELVELLNISNRDE